MKTLNTILFTTIDGVFLTTILSNDRRNYMGNVSYITNQSFETNDYGIYDACDGLDLSCGYSKRGATYFITLSCNGEELDCLDIPDKKYWDNLMKGARKAAREYEYYRRDDWTIKRPRTARITFKVMPIKRRNSVILAWAAMQRALISDIAALIITHVLELIRCDDSWYTVV